MRIQYTLPGLLPSPHPVEPAEQFPGTFKTTLQRVKTPSLSNWRRLLRVDRTSGFANTIGPPPRPAGFEMRDVAFERTRWRTMLDHKVALFERSASSGAIAGRTFDAVDTMLKLLLEFQRQEDSITARSLNEARG